MRFSMSPKKKLAVSLFNFFCRYLTKSSPVHENDEGKRDWMSVGKMLSDKEQKDYVSKTN